MAVPVLFGQLPHTSPCFRQPWVPSIFQKCKRDEGITFERLHYEPVVAKRWPIWRLATMPKGNVILFFALFKALNCVLLFSFDYFLVDFVSSFLLVMEFQKKSSYWRQYMSMNLRYMGRKKGWNFNCHILNICTQVRVFSDGRKQWTLHTRDFGFGNKNLYLIYLSYINVELIILFSEFINFASHYPQIFAKNGPQNWNCHAQISLYRNFMMFGHSGHEFYCDFQLNVFTFCRLKTMFVTDVIL